jgi:N-sulfoglucosamine sulfohydrolase
MRKLPFLLLALVIWANSSHAANPNKPWNVLLITADDLNADSVGWMGHPLKLTPNIDAFAAKAHQFVNNHVTVPICQPSRSAFMTGRVPHRNGALGFHPIREDVPTLVESLVGAGYFTAAINKTAHMKPDKKFPWTLTREGSGKQPGEFGKHVAGCLKAAAEAGKPFFLNANVTDPHRPFPGAAPNAKGKGLGDPIDAVPIGADKVPAFLEDLDDVRKEYAQYLTGVKRMDRSFGELMSALKTSGHADDTLIIFMSDHGMSFPFSKATVFRNGTWVPVLIYLPGMKKSQPHTEYVSSVDLMPTILDLLKLKQPPEMDGRSWLPLINAENQANRDYVITHVNTVSSGRSFAQRCVRTAERSLQFHAWVDGKTPLRVEAHNGLTFSALQRAAMSDARIKTRVEQLTVGTPLALYDISKDPNERHNVLDKVEYKKDLERLSQLLLDHMKKTDDPQMGAFRAALEKK